MNKADLLVVGGGITGLCVAYIAAKSGRKVCLLEKDKEFGGLLRTFEVGGNQLEFYYHHFFVQDKELQWLVKELGIEKELVYHETKMGIYTQGKIHDFSNSRDLLKFKSLSFFDKIRFGLSSIYLGKYGKWQNNENVPAYKWFKKYTGEKVTKTIWAPLLKVKFGKYFDKVPLAWMIGRLQQRMQSRKSGEEKLGYVKGSLNVLLQRLLDELQNLGVELINNVTIEELIVENNEMKGVQTSSKEYLAKKVVFTIPSPYMVNLVKRHNQELSQKLQEIKYFGAVCTILELKQKLSDIYWLNIAEEGYPFGGIIEHTNFISPENYNGNHIVYLSRYFTQDESIASMTQEQIKELMLTKLKQIYPFLNDDWVRKVHVYKTNTAATVCDLNFSNKVNSVRTSIDGLYIVNMAHVYPDERSVNNSIRIAANTCKLMGIETEFIPKGNNLAGSIGFQNS